VFTLNLYKNRNNKTNRYKKPRLYLEAGPVPPTPVVSFPIVDMLSSLKYSILVDMF
jgi:hypothetical protein